MIAAAEERKRIREEILGEQSEEPALTKQIKTEPDLEEKINLQITKR